MSATVDTEGATRAPAANENPADAGTPDGVVQSAGGDRTDTEISYGSSASASPSAAVNPTQENRQARSSHGWPNHPGIKAPCPPEFELVADLGDGFELWRHLREKKSPCQIFKLFSTKQRCRRVFWLGFNGERMAVSKDQHDLLRWHPEVAAAVLETLQTLEVRS